MVLPLWSRVLERVGRAMHFVSRTEELLRTELLLGFLPERHRSEFTFLAYSRLTGYLPGGDAYQWGLVPWELRLLEHELVPRTGKVLLAGAGGGRELEALCDRGYSVFAFEPTRVLFEGAKSVAARFGATCVQGSFADLPLAVGGLGPLASAPAPFDLIYFGWGSFTHITRPEEQLAALVAARALGPTAPLVVSFWLRWPTVDSRSQRFRKVLRAVLMRAGAVEPPEGLTFQTSSGFAYLFDRQEFETLARRAGYRVELLSDADFPHALLLPASDRDKRG